MAQHPNGHQQQVVSLKRLYWDQCYLIPSFTESITSINGTHRGIKCIITKFEDDTKLSDLTVAPEGQDAIHRVLDKLENQVHGNLIKFSKAKSKMLHLGQGKPWYQHRLRLEY